MLDDDDDDDVDVDVDDSVGNGGILFLLETEHTGMKHDSVLDPPR
jgi:hypothetical protein